MAHSGEMPDQVKGTIHALGDHGAELPTPLRKSLRSPCFRMLGRADYARPSDCQLDVPCRAACESSSTSIRPHIADRQSFGVWAVDSGFDLPLASVAFGYFSVSSLGAGASTS